MFRKLKFQSFEDNNIIIEKMQSDIIKTLRQHGINVEKIDLKLDSDEESLNLKFSLNGSCSN